MIDKKIEDAHPVHLAKLQRLVFYIRELELMDGRTLRDYVVQPSAVLVMQKYDSLKLTTNKGLK